MRTETPIDAAIVRQAISWLARLRGEDGAALRRDCEAWQQAHPDHARAWARAQALSEDLGSSFRALPDRERAIDTLQAAAARVLQRRRMLKLLSLAALGLPSAWLVHQTGVLRADYRTAIGERRRVQLADGSVLDLNTDSAVDLHFDATQRLITLRRGEILIRSGSDAAAISHRPLRVQTRDGLFEAIGTRFLVYQQDQATRLSVEEGIVEITPIDAAAVPALRAAAGSVVVVDRRHAVSAAGKGRDASAWVEGAIVARDWRLADFLAEVARYRSGHVGCDPAVADLRLSGVYRIDDTDRLLAILPRTLPVRVEYRTRWWVQLSAADG